MTKKNPPRKQQVLVTRHPRYPGQVRPGMLVQFRILFRRTYGLKIKNRSQLIEGQIVEVKPNCVIISGTTVHGLYSRTRDEIAVINRE